MKLARLRDLRPPAFLPLCAAGLGLGSVFALGFPTWLVPLFLLPFIAYACRPVVSFGNRVVDLLCFAVPYFAVTYVWILDANTTLLIGSQSSLGTLLTYFSWFLLLIGPLCSFVVLTYFLSERLRPQSTAVTCLLYLPAAWVGTEWLHSVLTSVLLYGTGGTIGDYWNFGSLGLAVMATPFAGASQVFGMYGLSFLIVQAAGLLYLLALKRYRLVLPIAAIWLALFTGALLLHPASSHTSTYRGSLLQTSGTMPQIGGTIPTTSATAGKKDLVVLPEDSTLFDRGSETNAQAYVNDRLSLRGVSINVASSTPEQGQALIQLHDKSGKLLASQTKGLLIPAGEYVPAVFDWSLRASGNQRIIHEFKQRRSVVKGSAAKPFIGPSFTIGSIACSGILSRSTYQHLAREGSQVFTNSASLLILKSSSSYLRESELFAKFHAIANDRYFIQASKGLPAFVVRNDGSYAVSPTRSVETQFIDFTFATVSSKTLYTKIGEWVLALALLIVLGRLLFVVVTSRGIEPRLPG